MTRHVVIAANWKMHKLRDEALEWTREFEQLVRAMADRVVLDSPLRIVVAPPVTLVTSLSQAASGFDVFAQNVHESDHGAYTGELSAAMLVDAGARGVILGHSERRALFGETDAVLADKLRAVVAAGLQPMLCVGETLEQRDADQAESVVEMQLVTAVDGLSGSELVAAGFTVAYEPVWAIGTGRTATPEIAQTMHTAIRAQLGALIGAEAADLVPILYGGSVKSDNITELLAQPDIDGALVGGASLEARSFAALVEAGTVRAGVTAAPASAGSAS